MPTLRFPSWLLALIAAMVGYGCALVGGRSTPGPADAAPDSFLVALETSRGRLTIAIHRPWAPRGVDRLYYLLRHRFYDDARFFRVIPGFVAQFGLPAEPSLSERFVPGPIPDDSVRHSNVRGTLVFAHAGPGTRQSQLFINLQDNPQLDAGFAPLGEIVDGMELIDLLNGEYDDEAGPSQDSIRVVGNTYLAREYPRLDFIRHARIVREWRGP